MIDELQDAATELGLGPDHNCFLGSSTLLLAQVPAVICRLMDAMAA